MHRDDVFIKREYRKALFPIMLSVLGGTVNTLIDSMFVSQKLGMEGLAAINMCLPLFFCFCTVGSLFVSGAAILSAQEIGNENMEKSRMYYHTAITLCVLVGLMLTVLGMFIARPLAILFSQGSSLLPSVYQYCVISFIGVIPTMLVYIPSYYLQIEGKLHSITIMMGITIVSDILLDWAFMFLFDFGISGAAWASVISISLTCIYGLFMMEHGFSNFHFSVKEIGFFGIRKILRYGSTTSMRNIMDAAKIFLLNMIILKAGGTKALAIWAVLNALNEFALCIVSGVPLTAAPMIGVYYTAKENSGIRILMKLQVKTGIMLSVFFTAGLLCLHRMVEQIFSIDESLLLPLLFFGCALLLEVICRIWGDFFNLTNHIWLSNSIMIFRNLIFPVAVVSVLNLMGYYLWTFLPLSGILSIAFVFILTHSVEKKQRKKGNTVSSVLLLDDELERDGKILEFSVKLTIENICNTSDQISEFCGKNEMNEKQMNRIRLVIEELLTVIAERNPDLLSADLRAFALQDAVGINVRYVGEKKNPFEEAEKNEDDFFMGISMIQRMARQINYNYVLGMNNINITF